MAQRPWNEPSRLSDEEEDDDDTIEVHLNRRCRYVINERVSSYTTEWHGGRVYTKKHLVRDCYCGQFPDRAYLLNKNGRDGEGYEIHKTRGDVIYCKWRKYRLGIKKFELVRKCDCGRYTDGEENQVNEPSRS